MAERISGYSGASNNKGPERRWGMYDVPIPQGSDRRFVPGNDVLRFANLAPYHVNQQASRETLPTSFFSQGVVFDRTEQQTEDQAFFYGKEWMQKEVDRVRLQPVPEGQTPWYHLAGTGFWVKEQIAQLLRNVTGVGKEAFPNVLEIELSKVKVDIEAFEREYMQQMASLQWNLTWGERDGKKRIICPDYKGTGMDKDGVLWSSTTSKDERDGVVFEVLFGNEEKKTTGVEGWLQTAPADSFAVIVSPAGWSGLTDADGNAIRYPETQLYGVHKKTDGSLEAYTFRYDANIAQNEEFQKQLGLIIPEASDQKERIKSTLSNVALLTPDDAALAERRGRKPIRRFEDIIDAMQQAVGGRNIAYGEGGEMKSFDDIKLFLQHPEMFAKRHPLTDILINRFQDYARWRVWQRGTREDLEKDLQIAMAMNPLQLNRIYRDKEQKPQYIVSDKRSSLDTEYSLRQLMWYANNGIDYGKEKEDLEQRPGCAGGGEKTNVISMGGVRKGEKKPSPSEDYTFDHEGTCVACNNGPKQLGPCDICITCDGEMGGKGAQMADSQKEFALAR